MLAEMFMPSSLLTSVAKCLVGNWTVLLLLVYTDESIQKMGKSEIQRIELNEIRSFLYICIIYCAGFVILIQKRKQNET